MATTSTRQRRKKRVVDLFQRHVANPVVRQVAGRAMGTDLLTIRIDLGREATA